MNHGEVRWCGFGAPDHDRPVVILTRDAFIPGLTAVTVAPITTKLRGVDSRVRLDESDGLREQSEVNLLSIQTVPKVQVGRFITSLRPDRMREINAAIALCLSFDHYA